MERNSNSIMNRIFQGSWRDALPPETPKIGVEKRLENSGHSWLDIWEKHNNYADIAESLGKIMSKDKSAKSLPLNNLHAYFDILENWVGDYGHVLTFPPSQEAWNNAVKATIEKKDLDMALVLSATFPVSFSAVIKNVDFENNVTKWFKTAKDQTPEAIIDKQESATTETIMEEKKLLTQSLKSETPVQNGHHEEKNKRESFTPQKNKDYILTENEKKCFDWISSQIKEVQERELPLGVEQNNMDNSIKKRKLSGGEFYFDTELFGAIIKLNKEQLLTLAKVWPEHQKIPVYDSLAFLSSPKFWKGLNSTNENKDFIIEKVLPVMLDISNLPFSNKYQIGKEILQYTTKSPELFMQRLNLWLNIGGDLVEKPTISMNFADDFDDDFSQGNMPKEESPNLLNWIINQKNNMWTKEVHNLLNKKGFKIEAVDNAYEELNSQKAMKL